MEIDQVMNRHDLTTPLRDPTLEELRKNLAKSVVDEDWKPDWAMIEADYLSEKISCNDLAKRYVQPLEKAIREKVEWLLDRIGCGPAQPELIAANVRYFTNQVIVSMAKRITRTQGAGNWTAKRKGRQMRVAAEVVEERQTVSAIRH